MFSYFRKSVRALTLASALVATLLVTTFPLNKAHAANGGAFGLGILIGDPTSLNAKYHLDGRQAIDVGLAFDFDRWFLIYGDWLYHFPGAFGGANEFTRNLTPYVGIGGLFVNANRPYWDKEKHWRYYYTDHDSSTAFGLRIPLGLEWRAPTIPLGVFLELVPGILIMPGTHGFFQGGIGVRFYF